MTVIRSNGVGFAPLIVKWEVHFNDLRVTDMDNYSTFHFDTKQDAENFRQGLIALNCKNRYYENIVIKELEF